MDKRKDWKVRILKSDLPELKERVQFLTGNAWDISIGVDGVEGSKDKEDGREVLNEIPETWCAEVMLQWIAERKRSRRKIAIQMREEVEHLQFVEDLAKRQLEALKEKEDKRQ